MYCYFNDGTAMKSVDKAYVPVAGEYVLAKLATPAQLSNAFPSYARAAKKELLAFQIAQLEAEQTPRRLREASRGTDNGWLAALDDKINALRAQLTGG